MTRRPIPELEPVMNHVVVCMSSVNHRLARLWGRNIAPLRLVPAGVTFWHRGGCLTGAQWTDG
jgi:hypothetical protein